MIELYLAIALFGVGSFLNNKKQEEEKVKEKKQKEKAKQEKEKKKNSKKKKMLANANKLFQEVLQNFERPETKKAYEDTKNIKVPYKKQSDPETEETEKFIAVL